MKKREKEKKKKKKKVFIVFFNFVSLSVSLFSRQRPVGPINSTLLCIQSKVYQILVYQCCHITMGQIVSRCPVTDRTRERITVELDELDMKLKGKGGGEGGASYLHLQ